jgi:DNA-binding PucR family transcriptional regulator
MIQFVDTASTLVADLYLRESQTALADADRVRRDLLELLIEGAPRAISAAHAAGIDLHPDELHHLLIAASQDDDQRALQTLAERSSSAFAQQALLVVVRHQAVTMLLHGESLAIIDSAQQLVAQHADSPPRIGISLPTRLADLGAAYRQASSALRLASPAEPVIALGRVSLLHYLIASADHTARLLVPEAVRALAASDKPSDRALIETFQQYIACGLNVQRTAAAIPAHPNTVHGRLRRLSELTGYDPREVEDVVRLAAELRLASMGTETTMHVRVTGSTC